MIYLDLDEWPCIARSRLPLYDAPFAPASFRREDHFGNRETSLKEAVLRQVESVTGKRPGGAVRMLGNLRHFGYYFSPLNLFYCFAKDGGSIEAVLAEVSNTPWNEKHCYVLWEGNRAESPQRATKASSKHMHFRHPKEFHVSPFMDLNFDYAWKISPPPCKSPCNRLSVHLENWKGEEKTFDATLSLKRRELTTARWLRTLAMNPWMTGQVVAGIYYQAYQLWRKRMAYYPHPNRPANQQHTNAGQRIAA